MILEGANKLKEDTNYTIYAINSTTAGQYCVVAPNSTNETINMLIDLHEKKLFDEIASGTKTKDDLINKLLDTYNLAKTKYPSGMLIVPMFNEEEYANAVNNLDKQKMFDETKKIGAITSELYKKMTVSGVEKQKINQKIIIAEKEEIDTKYINWLKEQMPNYVEGIVLEEEKEEPAPTPAVNVTDIFGTAAETSTPIPPAEPIPTPEPVAPTPAPIPEANSLFDNAETPVEPAPVEEPKVETPELAVPPTEPTPEPAPAPTPEVTSVEPAPTNVDIFGIPVDQPAAPPTSELAKEEPVAPTPEPAPAPQVEEPKAVQNVELEGTTTFSAVPNTPQAPVENTEAVAEEEPKKNGGFVNLAILLVVLIGVTIVSIELGKFLYSVYGA